MEGEATAAILQVLVQNLIDHSKKEISLIRGLDEDAAKLTGSLDTIQKYLNDAETRRIPGDAVKSWLKKLEDVAFDADNVLDELNYHHQINTIIKPNIKKKKLKVLSCFSSFTHISRSRKMALRIKQINDNLDFINKEARDLDLVARLADVPTLLNGSTFETDSFTVDPIFIGRDDVVSELVDMLISNVTTYDHERVISILPIVGMGGLGKTTLTRKLFNHEKSLAQFESRIWVHVSQTFDPVIIFKNILQELNSNKNEAHDHKVESRQVILKRLQEALKDKTYLVILDDVWNQDFPKWEDFINSLLGVTSSKGNAIVVTTRNMEVASIVKPFHIHELKGLSEEDCWSIIKEKTDARSEEFEAIGKNIGRRCQGSPLAANVVGGVLRNKSKEKWISIEQKWLSHDEGKNITKILKLSLDNLSPPSLKKCFAYCSIFPKGRRITKQKLIEYWMAEGFLHGSNDDMESVGENIINILLHNSLLQVARRDSDGYGESCVMHDLMHDLASSVLGCANDINGDGISSRVRYMTYSSREALSPVSKKVAKHVRTLFFTGEVSGTNVSDFECLHVLTLDGYEVEGFPSYMLEDGYEEFRRQRFEGPSSQWYKVEELPSSIRKLIHLRHLDISRTRIEYLPEWITELFYLITLRAYFLRELPSSFKYLINLRHLHFKFDDRFELPAEIGRLTSLRTLKQFRAGDKNGFKIEELGNMNNLEGEIEIRNLEKVRDKEEAGKANLFKKPNISNLCLRWERERVGNQGDDRNDEDVLEGLQPHPNLKKLEIFTFRGRRFPLWTMKMAVEDVCRGSWSWVGLNNLIEMRLSECHECEQLPMLGQLPNLKFLRLYEMDNVKCIHASFYGAVDKDTRSSIVVFPALERFELKCMPELADWEEVECRGEGEVKVFPRLQRLVMERCYTLFRVPNHFSPCLKYLRINNTALECLPDGLFYDNPNLSELDIKDCPNLRALPGGLHTLGSLEMLVIVKCESLESIADYNGGSFSFTSLRYCAISNCDALVSLPCEIVGPSLEELQLGGLGRVMNLPSIIDRLPESPKLTELYIMRVPNCMSSSSVEIWPFASLRELDMDFSVGESGSRSMETVEGILRGCCNTLDRLTLIGMESWGRIPESMQHLTASTYIKLQNFGMEELPEWFGNFSTLWELELCECRKLRRLPSVDAMRRLAALEYLTIKGCPALRVEQQTEGDSEWPKISHILNITIDEQ